MGAPETGVLVNPAEVRTDLAAAFLVGELATWADDQRAAPSEMLRCALFSARNHATKRRTYAATNRLELRLPGGGQVFYWGDELRQDDQTVWLQLVHLARASRSEWVEFTRTAMVKALGWTNARESYERLEHSINRLTGAALELRSETMGSVSARLLQQFLKSPDGRWWRVRVYSREDSALLALFARIYTRLDWPTRLKLPSGCAQWLHSYYTSHRVPYALKIETLAVYAGLKLDDDAGETLAPKRGEYLRAAKKVLVKAHEALVAGGFLQSFKVEGGLIAVVRASS